MVYVCFYCIWYHRVDLCHQANDEEDDDDDEENNTQQALLENSKNKPGSSNVDGHRRCCGFPATHLGSRQKIVIVVNVEHLIIIIYLCEV